MVMQRQSSLIPSSFYFKIISYEIFIILKTCAISTITNMTIKSLFNWGGFGGETERPKLHNERWHRDGWDYKSHSHSHGYHKGGSKGGGSSAALSALALLAFLFLINVMQQSLNENNSTAPMGATTVLLRQDSSPIILTSHEIETNSESREIKNFGDTGIIDSSKKKKSN